MRLNQRSSSAPFRPRLFALVAVGAALFLPRSAWGEEVACGHAEEAACAPAPLRAHRIAARPYWSHALAGGGESSDAIGVGVDGYLTDRFALGLDASLFTPFNGAASGGSERVTQAGWLADLRATFVILPAKEASWAPEIYALGGIGAIATRPVSVIDPANRRFTFHRKPALDAGIGARWFLTRALVVGVEVRDTVYNELEESLMIASAPAGQPGSAQDGGTWYGQNRVTQRVQVAMGATWFLPFP